MNDRYPLHVMIKPEGLWLFPDYIQTQLELMATRCGYHLLTRFQTILTPEQVELIYPGNVSPQEQKLFLTQHLTEHYFFQGNESIYNTASTLKGKCLPACGLRGTLLATAVSMGVRLQMWQNFIHISDNTREAHAPGKRLNLCPGNCTNCSAITIPRTS